MGLRVLESENSPIPGRDNQVRSEPVSPEVRRRQPPDTAFYISSVLSWRGSIRRVEVVAVPKAIQTLSRTIGTGEEDAKKRQTQSAQRPQSRLKILGDLNGLSVDCPVFQQGP